MTDAIAGFLAGLLGAMGFGGGGVLIVWLTLWRQVPQSAAQGLNLLLFLPCAALALVLHAKGGRVEKTAVLWAVPFGLLGAAAGLLMAGWLPQVWLRRGFGLLLALAGARELFCPKTSKDKNKTC